MIDRRSRLLLAQRSTGRKALPVLETLKAMFAKIPQEIRHTVLLIEEKNSDGMENSQTRKSAE